VQADSIKYRFESVPWFQRLKLEYDEPLSNVAFNFDLRRYIMTVVSPRQLVSMMMGVWQGLTLVPVSAQPKPF
jgi:hypothetical protein